MIERYTTRSEAETVRLGERLGPELLRFGAVITVEGELGAGKTHFVKGLAGSLGLDELSITSPTFALANEYACVQSGQPFTLFHLDCYRFDKPEELLELGVEDYFYPATGATIVEWPERIASLLPAKLTAVRIAVTSESDRTITVEERP